MVSTVSPKAKLTPRNPMPSDGKFAASTALPQPANVSQKVPKNSAPRRRHIIIHPPLSGYLLSHFFMSELGQNLKSSRRTYVFRFALKNGHRRLQPVQEVASLDLAPAKAKPSTPFSRSAE